MSRKIRLNPDALRVETFEPDAAAGVQGTVIAHDAAASGQSCTYNCTQGEPTCAGGCRTLPLLTCLC